MYNKNVIFTQQSERKFWKKYSSVARHIMLRQSEKEIMRRQLQEEVKSAAIISSYKSGIEGVVEAEENISLFRFQGVRRFIASVFFSLR